MELRKGKLALAPERTSFVGRVSELERLAEIAAQARLVTLLGPPGVGKTRLAQQFARQAEGRSPSWFCDLSVAGDVPGLLRAARRDLDAEVGAAASADAAEALGGAIAARGRTVVILDDAAQLDAAAVDLLAAWTAAAPEALLLVTSRRRLGVPEEKVFDLPPLSLPTPQAPHGGDAVALFRERASAVRGGLEERDADVVADLVRRLDGLPLAIELAAARMRLLGPRAILEGLARRFELLAAPGAATLSRHATLRAAIDASWEPLAEEERLALASCSVFHGGFDLAAAEAVIAPSAQAHARCLDLMQSLCDHSLVRVIPGADGRTRFALYQSVNEYAAEHLDAAATAEAEVRHASHYLRTAAAQAERADRTDPEALAWLAAEQDNLIAVHRRALAEQPRNGDSVGRALRAALVLDPLLFARGPTALRASLLDAALQATAEVVLPPATLAEAHIARGRVRQRLGETGGSVQDYQRALELARAAGDARLEGYALTCAGTQEAAAGRWSEARALQEQALSRLGVAGARVLAGRAWINLGNVLRWTGVAGEARDAYERGLELNVEAGDVAQEGNTLANLARLDQEEGRLDIAELRYVRAVALYRRCGDRRFLGPTLYDLGGLRQEDGRLDEARLAYDEARELLAGVSDRLWLARLTGRQGTWHEDGGELDAARRCYVEAVEQFERLGIAAPEALFLAHLGGLDGSRGRDGSADVLERAEAHLASSGAQALIEVVRVHRLRLDLARAARQTGQGAEARTVHIASSAWRAVIGEEGRAAPLDLRFARRHLQAELEAGGWPPPATREEVLEICTEGRWFRTPRGERVELASRRPLWLLLERLVQAAAGGVAVEVPDLAAAGWPAERLHPEVAARRVYVALSTLRSMGLRDLLARCDGGYRLDPATPLRVTARAR